MSTFKVEIVKIKDVLVHPNADRLEILTIANMDWTVVSQKGNFKPNDLAIYFPIDSVLPSSVENKIFGPDSKVKLTNSRVKTIKLRGALSQGMLIRPELFEEELGKISEGDMELDFSNDLGITKYEPVVKQSNLTNVGSSTKKQCNPNFRKYTGIENAKNYQNVFEENEIISVTEKIHGTNARAGYVHFHADTLFKKVKQFFRLAPKYEFVYGSHNVQLQSKLSYKGYHDTNVYLESVIKYQLKEKLKPGEVVYYEVYGDGIQKGYAYGCQQGERKAVFFDLMFEGKYLDAVAFRKWADEQQLPLVPELYKGPFNKDKVLSLRDGVSILNSSQSIREGVVVKPLIESTTYIGRKMLKYISDNYLLKNQDDESVAH